MDGGWQRDSGGAGGSGRRPGDSPWDALKSFGEITPPIRRHLVRVYTLLAATVASAAGGAWWQLSSEQPYAVNAPFWMLLAMGLMMGITFTRASPQNQMLRSGMLLGVGAAQGVMAGPLVAYSNLRDDTLVVRALVSTALVFGSFSMGALTARRRSMLYLGSYLMSGLSVLMWMSLFGMFFGGGTMFNAELLLGLAVFSGYIIYDTQLIIERASAGSMDYVIDGSTLFTNLFAVFVRILMFLNNRGRQRDEDDDGRGRRRKRF